jgi:COMPASS component SWD3
MDERSLKRQRVDTDSENESNYHSMDEFGSPPDEGTRSPAQQTRPRRSSYDSSEADEPGIASGATDELAHTFYRHSKDPRRGSSLIPPSEKEDGELSKGRFSTPSKPSSNDNYEPSMILKGHRKGVSMVKFSPDGNMIASCCMFKRLLNGPGTDSTYSCRLHDQGMGRREW